MMKTVIHESAGQKVVEIVGDGVLINTAKDALELMMNAVSPETSQLVFHQANLSKDFFDLKTGLAGDILQKAVNYGVRLAIVGNFSNVQSQSLKAFIAECNRGNQCFFTKDVPSAIAALT